jgi:uncharacterized protein YecA (UPF0149 family)
MAKVGRNDPCPCGSGKKFKKCCEPEKLRDAAQRASELRNTICDDWGRPWRVIADDPLDLLSNSVLTLIRDGHLDEADRVCERLRTEYPDVSDGLDRQAMVYEARQMWTEAADYYRQAAQFARDHIDEGYEQSLIDSLEDDAHRCDKRAQASNIDPASRDASAASDT